MWFIILKVLRYGFKAAKTHKANKSNPSSTSPNDITLSNIPSTTTNPPKPPRNALKTNLDKILFTLQFALALTVIGLYSQDINSKDEDAPAKWVYAVITAFLAACTALTYLILVFAMKARPLPMRQGAHLPLFAWEVVLCILWLVVFGVFGEMFIGVRYGGDEDSERAKKLERMRRAVWVDLVNFGFWVVSAAWRGVRWWRGRVRGGDAQSVLEVGGGDGVEKEVERV
ncbi:MARVEL domain-containing protein [Aspergillus candidus]|uniref:MARVEL domain-containing protein n=1 Tax=Aspergillus candidus TaxID=41067 RepID=A0A2I2FBC9_ASPCN|nr:hypothetical protein BDW47DRAFT_125925 [Aspergillus candidus]PLB37941.1 hypothetical protein BDW47DRAFT_125925 [Aspergillus candidus]